MNCKTCKTKFKDNGKVHCSNECYIKSLNLPRKIYPKKTESLLWKEYWLYKLKGIPFKKLTRDKFNEMNMLNGMGTRDDLTPVMYWNKKGVRLTQLFTSIHAK